ncbi:MAG: hypothetical protein QXY90_05520 [Candidatus Anstonellales archaeon]
MIKNKAILEEFETNLIRSTKADYQRNLKIFEGMLEEALFLKVLPMKNPLEGIEVDIKIARVINSV